MSSAFLSIIGYIKKVKYSDYKRYRSSENMIPITVIVPAYNEEKTIIDNIKSLLSLNYLEYEVIVVNDGSKDSTKDKVIEAFKLTKVNQPIKVSINTKEILDVYHNIEYSNLVLIDKLNGGKADAINAGINASRYPVFACIDADSILEKDSLIKLAMAFVENSETVAVGGIVRIANGAVIREGSLIKTSIPKSPIAAFQIVEYLRAFLAGRTYWSKNNSMLIISGAFGAFNKNAVIQCGGYKVGTIGEDMEIIMRLHKTMLEQKKKYKITFLADPICWTQAPEGLKGIKSQRKRWQIGLMDTLFNYRKMLLNPKYGRVGMLSLPYFWIVEFLGCIIEFLGYLIIPLAYFFGALRIENFLVYFTVAILYGAILSLGSILIEQISFKKYTSLKDILLLSLYSILENFGYRQVIILFRISGIINYRKARHTWGTIKRSGFMEQ
jgi:cellulose synthase/poly-beta-1,6-N-acetylglucosamine synthase-like glycosyltransferase